MKRIDITGNRYGRLKVISYGGNDKSGHSTWKCQCDCGNEIIVSKNNLTCGATSSCGCIRKEMNHRKGYVLVDARMDKCVRDGSNVANITGKLYTNNKTGYKGVNWSKIKNCWIAEITYQGRKYYLCRSSNINDCAEMRKLAESAVKNNEFEQFITELKASR